MPLGKTSNAQLQQAEQAIQAKIPQQLQAAFAKVVHAGLTILYSPQLRAKLQQRISQGGNVVQDASQGAVRMIFELYKQSGNKIPTPLLVPAAIIFAFEYLDLVAQAGRVPITSDVIAKAAQATGDTFLQAAGVSQQKLQQMAAQRQQGGAQPQAQTGAAPGGLIGSQMQGAQ